MAVFLLPASFMKTTMLSLCVAVVTMSAVGCRHHQRRAEGPMERAGEKVDHAAETVKDDAKDAKDTVKRKVK